MECPLQQQNLQVKDSREKRLCVLSQGIEFDIAVQSIMIVTASVGRVWVDLCNYYEMRELMRRNA